MNVAALRFWFACAAFAVAFESVQVCIFRRTAVLFLMRPEQY
jgi:hypothetical protein